MMMRTNQSFQSTGSQRKSNIVAPPLNEFVHADQSYNASSSQNQVGASTNVFDLARGRDGNTSQSEEESKYANTYQFRLSEERYLEGLDTRCIIQYDEEKFAACVWGQSEIYIIDREKPDAVNSFETLANPCKQNLCMQLLPFFDPITFPFAFVLS
jgi:hypothetical protein